MSLSERTPARAFMASFVKSAFSGLACGLILSAQSIRIEPSRGTRTEVGSISAVLDTPQNKVLVALQWEIVVPPAIKVGKEDIVTGKAAEAARKSLTCAASTRPSPEGSTRYVCILAGGQDQIRTGPIFVVRYRAQTDVQGAPIRVAIEKIVGVTTDLERITIPRVDAIITIPKS
jgi:hypothetical protein